MLIKVTRRNFLLAASAAPLAAELKPTPLQTIGPFFPADRVWDHDSDLTRVRGKQGRAKGEVYYVAGRVTDIKGEPVPGAEIEIWQANAAGKYRHGADENPAPIDPNLEGFAIVRTDDDGQYRFKTIKPGAYGAGFNVTRPPHIHVDVTGQRSRLISQMYFPGDPEQEKDQIFQRVSRKEALVAKMLQPEKGMEPKAKFARWDIVLNRG